ncbi:MAG: TVP38/TMEM64 family protein [Clostridiales bacterium]|nr:TVP38/TMEM64 family protein [Clostridiales bacterium]
MKKRISHILIVVGAIVLIIGAVYLILYWTGVWEKINSVEKLQMAIKYLGFWGRVAFVSLQLLQVTFLPLPSPIIVGAGALIYGPFEASLLSLAGILMGSALAFFIGRVFGEKVVVFMVGEESCKKWQKFLNKCKYSFILMMLLPLFPDDILCLVAGLTDMSWEFFMTSQFIARPIGIFLVSYFSSGTVIPYQGWGLIVWGILLVVSIILIYLSSKYNEKIEKFIKKFFVRQ